MKKKDFLWGENPIPFFAFLHTRAMGVKLLLQADLLNVRSSMWNSWLTYIQAFKLKFILFSHLGFLSQPLSWLKDYWSPSLTIFMKSFSISLVYQYLFCLQLSKVLTFHF